MLPNQTVFVVDDDAKLRESVCALVASMSVTGEGFSSAEEFLARYQPGQRGVVVVDLRMPGMSGLRLQEELARREWPLPLIILTAYARTPVTVQAIKAGAVTVIDKPYNDDDLWDAIQAALAAEAVAWEGYQRRRQIHQRLGALTPDERQVLDLILSGKPNKAIAGELGLGLRTVEKRRHSIISKLGVGSLAEMVAMVLETGTISPHLNTAPQGAPRLSAR